MEGDSRYPTSYANVTVKATDTNTNMQITSRRSGHSNVKLLCTANTGLMSPSCKISSRRAVMFLLWCNKYFMGKCRYYFCYHHIYYMTSIMGAFIYNRMRQGRIKGEEGMKDKR